MVNIVSWRLVYAFIEEKECPKKEKTCRQNWKIADFILCAHAGSCRSSANAVNKLTYSENGRQQPQLKKNADDANRA